MTEGNGSGGVKITGQMLLVVVASLIMLWASWITSETLTAAKNAETAVRRIDAIASTLSCTQRDGNTPAGEGK